MTASLCSPSAEAMFLAGSFSIAMNGRSCCRRRWIFSNSSAACCLPSVLSISEYSSASLLRRTPRGPRRDWMTSL
jgi:hypothetical protein